MLSFQLMNAQNDDTKRADKHFNRLEFVDAIKDYEKLISKGKANAYVYKQLALQIIIFQCKQNQQDTLNSILKILRIQMLKIILNMLKS